MQQMVEELVNKAETLKDRLFSEKKFDEVAEIRMCIQDIKKADEALERLLRILKANGCVVEIH